jgi:hypothetical protein
MPLSPIKEPERKFTERRLEFAKLAQGPNIIRILDEDYVAIQTHYVNRTTLKCLEDDCPICQNNRKIYMDNPETFRDIKGYTPRSTRYFLNVFDKTDVKICPQCHAEIKQTGIPTCPECNTIIMNEPVVPLNKVKVLSKGKTFIEQLISLENAVLDEERNRRGLTNFDLTVMVAGAGKTATTTPIFSGVIGAKPEVTPDMLYDLNKAVITLTPAEIKDFLLGISIKDIYTARGANHAEAVKPVEQTDELKAAITSALDLFKE